MYSEKVKCDKVIVGEYNKLEREGKEKL